MTVAAGTQKPLPPQFSGLLREKDELDVALKVVAELAKDLFGPYGEVEHWQMETNKNEPISYMVSSLSFFLLQNMGLILLICFAYLLNNFGGGFQRFQFQGPTF